jgi:hypothetical protein
MKRQTTTFWGGFVLALTVAAIVVPVAQAKPTPAYTTGEYGAPSSISVAPATSERSATTPDYKTGEYGAPGTIGLAPKTDGEQTSTTTGSYKTGEFGAPNIIGLGPKVSESTSQPVTTTNSDGFSWRDAGIGAGAVLLVGLILTSALLLSRRRQAHVAV